MGKISPAIIKHELHVSDRLIAEANVFHGEAVTHAKQCLVNAVASGQKLAEIKETIKHGEFLRYIEEKFDAGTSTCQKYMMLAAKWDDIKEAFGPGQASMMSISEACKYLARQVKDKPNSGQYTKPKLSAEDESPISEECPKGGEHAWEEDEDLQEEVCRKCHDPRAAHGEAPAGDTGGGGGGSGEVPGAGGDAEVSGDDRGNRLRAAKAVKRMDDLFGELTRLIDEIGADRQGTGEFKHALNMAYMEFGAWRKQ